MSAHPTPLQAGSAVEEPAGTYLGLIAAARATAAQIAATPADGLAGSAAYIHRVSQELVRVVPDSESGDDVAALAVGECLRRLAANWPQLADGTMQGEQIFTGDPTLWTRAMTEFPMDGYARLAARYLIENQRLGGQVIELGAGVGSCSALVAGHVGDGYVRTDLQPALLKRQRIRGSVSRYDFNEPGAWRDVDTIFAVNALHCATDKVRTLRHIFEMLRPGGVVVLGEGAPYTDDRRTPWPLNGFFGLFRGWWDVGGFLSRDEWLTAFARAGFRNAGWANRIAGAHDLGGLVWAER